jgi:hypothetical protein
MPVSKINALLAVKHDIVPFGDYERLDFCIILVVLFELGRGDGAHRLDLVFILAQVKGHDATALAEIEDVLIHVPTGDGLLVPELLHLAYPHSLLARHVEVQQLFLVPRKAFPHQAFVTALPLLDQLVQLSLVFSLFFL